MPSKPDELQVLFADANLVAVAKPAGLATIPGRGERDSVLERLAAQLNLPHAGTDDPRVRVVHRLDKDTSGVLLFAKNVTAQRHLSHQFQNNAIDKEYLALVAGRPGAAEGDIDAPLAPHPTSPKRMTVFKHGRPARTLWRVEETFRDFALLRCFPKTGKTHQIRVHLKHAGMPLAIDPLYNPPRPMAARGAEPGIRLSQFKRDYRPTRGEEERPLIARLTLHAHRLTFANLDGQPITIEAELPRDFRAVLNQLRRHSRR
jgi:23S rRNA pseudouridine955/2504/2580 synthase/23S rRNA pseudouridine1911/1915/1917 synthase